MNDQTISTPYGLMDRVALHEAEQSFDTLVLLRMVEELDRFTVDARQQDGLRDQLMQLHAMAHSVINGARLSVPAGESLTEAAADVLNGIDELIESLQHWRKPLEVLRDLAGEG
jgi:hypothetical protein